MLQPSHQATLRTSGRNYDGLEDIRMPEDNGPSIDMDIPEIDLKIPDEELNVSGLEF